MLITFVRELSETSSSLTIGVSEDQADEVTGVLAMGGWHPLSKAYGPSIPVIDSLQVALLQVSTLPAETPIRLAVEFGVYSAILSSPLWRRKPGPSHELVNLPRLH